MAGDVFEVVWVEEVGCKGGWCLWIEFAKAWKCLFFFFFFEGLKRRNAIFKYFYLV